MNIYPINFKPLRGLLARRPAPFGKAPLGKIEIQTLGEVRRLAKWIDSQGSIHTTYSAAWQRSHEAIDDIAIAIVRGESHVGAETRLVSAWQIGD